MRTIKLFLLGLALLFAVNMLIQTKTEAVSLPFEDDFENIAVGIYPSANGWQNMFSGKSAYVSDEQAHSGSRSFRLQSQPGWSRTDYVALPELPDHFSYEMSVYPDANPSVRMEWIGFPKAFGNQGAFYNRFNILVWNGSVGEVEFTQGIPGSPYIEVGEFTVGTWVTVRADLDFTSLTADLWLNGELAVTDVEITPKEFHHAGFGDVTLNKFGATEYNWTAGVGTGVIYIDDVRLVDLSTLPPIADAGEDQLIECACQSPEGTRVTLDGIGSSDPSGDPLEYLWTGPFVESPVSGPNPIVTLIPGCLGMYEITLVVNDGHMDSVPDTVLVTVIDTTSPDVTCSVVPEELRPPTNQLFPVDIFIEASDICSETSDLYLFVTAISSDPDDTKDGDPQFMGDVDGYDGYTVPVDITYAFELVDGIFFGTILLRAECVGNNDRIYTLTATVTDESGNSETTNCEVFVLRNEPGPPDEPGPPFPPPGKPH